MAMTKCGKCDKQSYEIVEKSPNGSAFKVMFVQCASCGTPIGTMDFYNTHATLQEQNKTLRNLESRLADIEHMLRQKFR